MATAANSGVSLEETITARRERRAVWAHVDMALCARALLMARSAFQEIVLRHGCLVRMDEGVVYAKAQAAAEAMRARAGL